MTSFLLSLLGTPGTDIMVHVTKAIYRDYTVSFDNNKCTTFH